MSAYPIIGEKSLCRPLRAGAFEKYHAKPVRTLCELQQVTAIRAAVYMSEQYCPYEEEFDGNDLCATHFLVFDGSQPVGTLRMRWFNGYAKLERVTLLPSHRGKSALHVMLAEAFELASRKGYRKMLGQIQSRLWPVWRRVFKCKLLPGRSAFWFSDFEYLEIEIFLAEHPDTLTPESDPYRMIRPEGSWDQEGVLDKSSGRSIDQSEAA